VRDRAHGVRIGRLRITVAPGAGADIQVVPIDPELVFPAFTHAVTLRRLAIPGGLGAHKWADRRLLTEAEAEALVVDNGGDVLEASRANVFLVEDGAIVTPPADGRILPGVTRRRLLELLQVREESVSFDRLLAADEVFLTGSVRGVEPVRGCDGRREGREGAVTSFVSGELRRQWAISPLVAD
jgi:para-aminobenzoate synthetase / 4-amino-4-deoxychorismate lyase